MFPVASIGGPPGSGIMSMSGGTPAQSGSGLGTGSLGASTALPVQHPMQTAPTLSVSSSATARHFSSASFPKLTNVGSQKPEVWVQSLINRFEEQLPVKTGIQTITTRTTLEQQKEYLINISRCKFSLVIQGLTKMLQNVASTRIFGEEAERSQIESQLIILDTLEQCLVNGQPKDTPRVEEQKYVNLLLPEICQFLNIATDNPLLLQLKLSASKVLFALSLNNFNSIFSRISTRLAALAICPDECVDLGDVELIQHINVDRANLAKVLNEIIGKFKQLKKNVHISLIAYVEKAIWNFMDTYPEEFMSQQKVADEDLAEACEKMFDLLDFFTEGKSQRKVLAWPLQVMLLMLSPMALEEVVNADNGAPCTPKHLKKKQFLDHLRKSLVGHGTSKQLTEGAGVACVKLCKASTYISNRDSTNVVFMLVQTVIGDLKALIFNPNKPFSRGANYDVDLMIDCFVAFFHINPHNLDVLKVCLNLSASPVYHFVLVNALHRIATQPRLPFWPSIDILYNKVADLRVLFIDTLTYVCQGCGGVPPIRFAQNLSLKEKVSTQLKFREKTSEEVTSYKYLLVHIVRLMSTDPLLFLYNASKQNTEMLINGLVSVVHQNFIADLAEQAMEALLVLHQPCNIVLWNMEAPLPMFWDTSSSVLFSISQKLIQHQIANYNEVLKWLREILKCRNAFLSRYKDNANTGSNIAIARQAQIKLEVVLFMYLWSIDIEAVLTAMSCFQHLCEEVEIRATDEFAVLSLLPNYQIYHELTQAAQALTTGRAQLQKRIMGLLRRIDKNTLGVAQAWDETHLCWDESRKFLSSFPKIGERPSKRRTSHSTSSSSPEHELDDVFSEWLNMTGFLCALGGVSVQKKSTPRPMSSVNLPSDSRKVSIISAQNSNQDLQYCPVTQFCRYMLSLLVCNNERFGPKIQKHVKELLGHELNPQLYPILFEQIRTIVEKFFDSNSGQVVISDLNTQFVEHIVFVIRNILTNKTDKPAEDVGATSIESMILGIVRYCRHLDSSQHSLHIKQKFCQLVETLMHRRDDLAFRQEMKFRNKLVEYLSDWVLGNSHQITAAAAAATAAANVTSAAVVTNENREAVRELDCAAVKAIAALLTELPLQPEENDRGDIVDAKSQLFLKYFTLFMNLLNECGHAGDEKGKDDEVQTIDILRTATIQAMSNLLSANVESGLVHSISLGYHNDLQTRVAFLEVLTKILQQGTEFDTLAENIAADRFERLVELLTMIDDKGELPIANALANVAPSSQVDDVARVFVSIFEAKHLLYELLWNLFVKEVELADCMQTIFRGTTLASKVMACCFRMFGASYITSVVKPHVESMLNHPDQSYEIDPNRLDGDVNILLAAHKKNLEIITQRIFDSITSSLDKFPPQLRCLCTCLYNVIAQRFPPPSSISAVGTVIFLRFINPVIVSPVENGIMDMQPASNVKRGLMYVSKILQNVASHVLFSKEQHMRPLNDFLRANFDDCRRFFVHITADGPPPPDPHGTPSSYINDVNVLSLHRLLYYNQEKIGEHLGSNRDHKAGRRPFDKLATLLAHLGPPEHKSMESQWSVHGDLSYNRFEEIMSKQHIHEKDEFKSIKSMNIFYQSGKSSNGHPVFYYIARKYKMNEHHADMLIYHVLLALKPFQHQRFELVIDFTHTCAENRFRTEVLTKWSAVLPVQVYDNLSTIYIYNCSTWVKEYFKFHESFLSAMKGSRKLYFVESISRLNEFLESGARLPSTTNSLEEDLKVFHGALKLSHKDTKVSIKLGSSAIQITSAERTKVLGHPVLLNDVYYAGEIEEVILVDDNQFTLSLHEQGPLSFIHDNCDEIVQAIIHIRTRWELSQPDNVINVHSKIRPKAVPGTLLNISLLNLGSPDPSLRSAAYNLLCALTATFNLKIEGQLLETAGLCIPANNTIFIKSVSEKLAVQEPHLTLEFMEECIQGFKASTIEIKHLVLEYVPPWLGNLTRFCKHSDEQKRQKVALILDKLITLTLQEEEMYPSIIAKIWGNLGQVSDLLDMILDSFIKRSVTGGLGSTAAEILADTAVALASSNVDLVAKKIIQRLLKLIDKTCVSPTWTLEQHLMFEDIGILTRYLLMLSFNNQLDVVKNLPYLLHFVAMLLSTGPIALRASIHGLVINIIHSLLTCSTPVFTEATQKILRLALTEFSLPKFYSFFGITAVKSAAVTAFRFSHRPGERSLAPYAHLPSDHSRLSLASLEAISDALLEITEACMEDIPSCDWLERWTSLARSFAIRYNPSLQPRALVVFGCISKQVTDQDVKQLLRILVKALESFSDVMLIDAIIMCLTRLEPILRAESPIHKALFWIAICILQLDEVSLYSSGLALLEQNLHTLDSQGVFEYQGIEEVLMSTREPLEWQYFKQLDHAVGMSFKNAFHFALVGHLVKGFRHPEPESINRTVRILSMLLTIVSKPHKRDRFEVTCESVPYLAALLPVSEEVRSRCRLKHMVLHNGGGMATMSESMDSIDGDSLAPGAFYDEKDGSVTGTIARRQKSCEVLSGVGRASAGHDIPPPQNVYAVSPQGERSISLLASPTGPMGLSLPAANSTGSGSTGGAETPKSWKSLDLEQMESVSGAGLLPSPSIPSTISVAAAAPGPSTGLLLSPSNPATRPVFLRSQRSSSMPTHNAGLKSVHATHSASAVDERNRTVRTSVSGDSSVLLDPEFLTDYPTQALTLSILATIVRHTTDENEARILYQYLAEASVVFPKVFPVIHSLLDAKINSVLQLCHDQAILEAVQSIIHNMITCEEAMSLQQPPQSLQSLGFGGLWRFAGPFNRASASADSAELFVNCLEAMVETCLPGDDGDEAEGDEYGLGTGTGSLNSSVAINLSNSLSSLSLGSPTDKEASHDFEGALALQGAARRGYAHLHGHGHALGHPGHHQRSSSCKRTAKAPATGKQHEI